MTREERLLNWAITLEEARQGSLQDKIFCRLLFQDSVIENTATGKISGRLSLLGQANIMLMVGVGRIVDPYNEGIPELVNWVKDSRGDKNVVIHDARALRERQAR